MPAKKSMCQRKHGGISHGPFGSEMPAAITVSGFLTAGFSFHDES
jgi:hypothetical protein